MHKRQRISGKPVASTLIGPKASAKGKHYTQSKTLGGTVVKNPPANAGNREGFKPWSGKIPHAAEHHNY